MSGVLLDTNLLIYAYATDVGDARIGPAKAVFEKVARDGNGHVSVQNLTEFSSVCLTKRNPPVPSAGVRKALEGFEVVFRILEVKPSTVRSAISAVESYRFSFWDSLIWAVAREHGISEILSEDFQDGQEVEGVRFRNPLKSAR